MELLGEKNAWFLNCSHSSPKGSLLCTTSVKKYNRQLIHLIFGFSLLTSLSKFSWENEMIFSSSYKVQEMKLSCKEKFHNIHC